jgi:hypothetical protein
LWLDNIQKQLQFDTASHLADFDGLPANCVNFSGSFVILVNLRNGRVMMRMRLPT